MSVKKIVVYLLIPLSLILILGITYTLSALINITNYPYIYDGFQELMVFSNSPIVSDKSFQEAAMRGANTYGEEQYNLYGDDAVKVGQANPQTIDNFTQYQDLMRLLYQNGASVLVSAGYNVLDSLLGQTDYSTYTRVNNGVMFESDYANDGPYPDKKFVIIDDATHSSSMNRNVVSFRFESEYGGFLSGVSAAVYSTYISGETGVPNKVSTFGGQPFSTVYDWMSGYEQGINWFNYAILGYDLDGNLSNSDALLYGSDKYDNSPVELTNGTSKTYQINYNSKASDPTAWYTGTFVIGDGTSISAGQIDAGSQVIFPVAGGQTADALNQVQITNSAQNKNIKVIGVDSDAADSYPNNAGDVLGSGIKSVDSATEMGLWYTDRFINEYNFDVNLTEDNAYDQEMYYLMTHTPQGDDITTTEIESGEPGWVEYNPAYTDRDFATMSDQEIDDYFAGNSIPQDETIPIAYLQGADADFYEQYGEEYLSPDGSTVYSSEFVANYDNGGLSFNGSTSLDQAYSALRDEAISLNPDNQKITSEDTENISALYDYAIAQNLVIENASDTFASVGSKTASLTDQAEITWYMNAVGKWMPDWTNY